jgi:hypothetical protein
MKHLTDSTLNVIERASSKLGPLSSLLDKVVERVVPATTASACLGALCKTTCDTVQRCNAQHLTYGHKHYSNHVNGCLNKIYTCSVRFCGC